VLVCLAVWLAMAGRSVTDKVLAIVFPITAFVAAGFEHSIANLYFIPLGMLLQEAGIAEGAASITWSGFAQNIIPVTLGNLIGGAGFVGLVYHLVYRRGCRSDSSASPTFEGKPAICRAIPSLGRDPERRLRDQTMPDR
jgi:formate transporter